MAGQTDWTQVTSSLWSYLPVQYQQGAPFQAWDGKWYAYATQGGNYYYHPVAPSEYVKMRAAVSSGQQKMAKLHDRVQQRLKQVAEEKEALKVNGMIVNNFLLGCDPEWVALSNGATVNIAKYVGNGEIGYDHGGRVGEFRPRPAKHAYMLLQRIRQLIKSDVLSKIPASKIRGGAIAGGEAIGGHVHIDKDPFTLDGPRGYVVCTEHRGILAGLDALTRRLEHLDILPKTEVEERRVKGYGKYTDTRYDHNSSSGLKRRFEYRTLPSWLFHPKTAMICLTAAKLAAAHPETVLETLKDDQKMPFTRLKAWFDIFKNKDVDAAKVRDALDKGLRSCIKDPDADIRETWETLGV